MFAQSKRQYIYLKFTLRLSCFDWSLQPRTPVLPSPHPNATSWVTASSIPTTGPCYCVLCNCHYKHDIGEGSELIPKVGGAWEQLDAKERAEATLIPHLHIPRQVPALPRSDEPDPCAELK